MNWTKKITHIINKLTSTSTTDSLSANQGRLLGNSIAIIEDTDNATHDIAKGQYVLWKGSLCKASKAFGTGDSLTSGLNSVPNGLGSQVASLNDHIATQSATVAKANANYTYGNVVFEKTANHVRIMIEGFISLPAQGYTDICAIPTGFAPRGTKYFDVVVGTNESGANLRNIRFKINGTTLSVYNYSTELSNTNAQPIVMYIC